MKVTHTTEKMVTEVPMVTITMTQEEADLLKDISYLVFYSLMDYRSVGGEYMKALHTALGGVCASNPVVREQFPVLTCDN